MKRKLSLYLALSMSLSMTNSVSAKEFTDTKGSWAENVIGQWSDYNVLGGYADGSFNPSGYITRAEVSAVIDKVMKYKVVGDNTFNDLTGKEWYANSMLKNVAADNIKGYNGGVHGNDYITRQEVAAIICSAFNIAPVSGSTTFADDANIADWAKGSVKALQSAGYVNGRQGNKFAPKENITRAEVVAILDNIVEELYTSTGTYSANVEGNVVVNAEDVVLKDTTINGDLFVAAGVGEGDLTLDNVNVTGNVIVEGGGSHSVKFTNGSKAKEVRMQKNDNSTVRLYIDENSSVVGVATSSNAPILLEGKGNFGTVALTGTNNATVAENTTIQQLVVKGGGNITNNGTIAQMVVDALAGNTVIKGAGQIAALTVNNKGVDVDTKVATMVVTNENATVKVSEKVEKVQDNKGNDVKDKVTGTDSNNSGANSNGNNSNNNSGNDNSADGDNSIDEVDTIAPEFRNAKIVNVNDEDNDGIIDVKYNYSLTEKSKVYSLFTKKSNYDANKLSSKEIVNMITMGANKDRLFESKNYLGTYGSGYWMASNSSLENPWFENNTEYVLTLVAVDEAGNISKQNVLDFTTNIKTPDVDIEHIDLSINNVVSDVNTKTVSFDVIDSTFKEGTTFSYVAVQKLNKITSGSAIDITSGGGINLTPIPAPTFEQVVAGLDGNGNVAKNKGNNTAIASNYINFKFGAEDDTEYDIYAVATNGKAKSEVEHFTVRTAIGEIENPNVEIEHIDLSITNIVQNADINMVSFNVVDSVFEKGTTFSYVAVQKLNDITSGGGINVTPTPAPTFEQVVVGLDGNGNVAKNKGNETETSSNYTTFRFYGEDNTEYDIYAVARNGKVKSEIEHIAINTDITAPQKFGTLDYIRDITDTSFRVKFLAREGGTYTCAINGEDTGIKGEILPAENFDPGTVFSVGFEINGLEPETEYTVALTLTDKAGNSAIYTSQFKTIDALPIKNIETVSVEVERYSNTVIDITNWFDYGSHDVSTVIASAEPNYNQYAQYYEDGFVYVDNLISRPYIHNENGVITLVIDHLDLKYTQAGYTYDIEVYTAYDINGDGNRDTANSEPIILKVLVSNNTFVEPPKPITTNQNINITPSYKDKYYYLNNLFEIDKDKFSYEDVQFRWDNRSVNMPADFSLPDTANSYMNLEKLANIGGKYTVGVSARYGGYYYNQPIASDWSEPVDITFNVLEDNIDGTNIVIDTISSSAVSISSDNSITVNKGQDIKFYPVGDDKEKLYTYEVVLTDKYRDHSVTKWTLSGSSSTHVIIPTHMLKGSTSYDLKISLVLDSGEKVLCRTSNVYLI